ncbi:MAG: CIC family chloride channel protein [Lentisphaeria bacterium]|jgi:CIC family chloride channel protein
MSVSHVIDRMHNHQGKLTIKNWLVQLLGAIIAIISGQSVGREGPVTHLGASAASQFGQWLRLPNNSIHTIVSCGVAAAISASFNTPMAGVIFAMEVLAMTYSTIGFAPVIMASVMGSLVSHAVYGEYEFITVGDTNIASLLEFPIMMAAGAIIALCAGIYIHLNIFALRLHAIPISLRLAMAGLLTACAAYWVPEIMGNGYDTVNGALAGRLVFLSLAIIALTKLIVPPPGDRFGRTGGDLIVPLLFVGACVGGAMGYAAVLLFPSPGANPAFYVMMGMAGMMAAVLNAHLTALVTMLELTYNLNIIFPAMLVIVVACVLTRQVFGFKGIFIEQLRQSKRQLDFGLVKQALSRSGARSVMNTNFVITKQTLTLKAASELLLPHPMWIISDESGRYTHSMRAADLANYLSTALVKVDKTQIKPNSSSADKIDTKTDKNLSDATNANKELPTEHEKTIDLLEIPSRNYRLCAIQESASLLEAMQSFKDETTELLYVSRASGPLAGHAQGILTLSAIENYYKPMEFRNVVD